MDVLGVVPSVGLPPVVCSEGLRSMRYSDYDP